MASNIVIIQHWVCIYCKKKAGNKEELDELYKKEKWVVIKEGENVCWMKCTSCDQSFHVECMLKSVKPEEWSKIKENIKREVNLCAAELPHDKEGKRVVEDPTKLISFPLYQCKKWWVFYQAPFIQNNQTSKQLKTLN